MKKRSVFLVTSVLVLCVLCLTGCSKYSSSYSAVGLVHSNTSEEAFMSFSSFEGTMVFQLSADDDDDRINGSAALESGSLTVYVDDGTVKQEWFSLHAGERFSLSGTPHGRGTVYIIVETQEKCGNGRLEFEMD